MWRLIAEIVELLFVGLKRCSLMTFYVIESTTIASPFAIFGEIRNPCITHNPQPQASTSSATPHVPLIIVKIFVTRPGGSISFVCLKSNWTSRRMCCKTYAAYEMTKCGIKKFNLLIEVLFCFCHQIDE